LPNSLKVALVRALYPLILLLDLLQSLLDSHCAASVFESADSIRKAPAASKQETIGRYKQKTPYQIGV
jgi:hypothetical protein